MKRLPLICVLCLLSAAASAQEAKPPINPPPSAATAKSAPVKIAGLGRERRELTFRERRQLGLTIANAKATAVEVAKEGTITVETDQSITCSWVMDRLISRNPEAFNGIDKDAVLELIEAWFRQILEALKEIGQ